eukprot:scaffold7351_cov28-Tisochrysis_lutea.AAC.6
MLAGEMSKGQGRSVSRVSFVASLCARRDTVSVAPATELSTEEPSCFGGVSPSLEEGREGAGAAFEDSNGGAQLSPSDRSCTMKSRGKSERQARSVGSKRISCARAARASGDCMAVGFIIGVLSTGYDESARKKRGIKARVRKRMISSAVFLKGGGHNSR